jgi:TRAP-type C4-dicarboxylate transport system permease small subunit
LALVYAIEQGSGFESPSMDFQMFWVYLVFPISGVLITIFAVGKILEINYYPDTLERDYRMRFKIDEEAAETSMENLD